MSSVSNPTCPTCSKPIRSGTLVLFEHGEIYHVPCRSRALELTALEEVDRARATQARTANLLEDTARRRLRKSPRAPTRGAAQQGTCPVCRQRATLTDWRPSVDWMAIEGCACNGFFVWTGLLDSRLPALTTADRLSLSLRIREVRGSGHEAWCTTADGAGTGPLVVRTERPDRSR
jgi:hypothetical protein